MSGLSIGISGIITVILIPIIINMSIKSFSYK